MPLQGRFSALTGWCGSLRTAGRRREQGGRLKAGGLLRHEGAGLTPCPRGALLGPKEAEANSLSVPL